MPPCLLVPVPLPSPCLTPSFPFRAAGFRARRRLYLVRLSTRFRLVQARRGFPRNYGEAGGDLFGCALWGRFAFLWFFFRGKSTRRWYMTGLRASRLLEASRLILQALMERHKLSCILHLGVGHDLSFEGRGPRRALSALFFEGIVGLM